ncbi:hypothetical protein CKO15_09135 [Halorhodospira abdelmalekii]|uniref:hypothetical protein n=1 Tax=Halorhodospira abdelmalekii TaxID=421629 RepID=UPI0019048FE0|nr:hypothetical protein [Halorhodospira abdelmalekii]MBK1735443.1 hypothetical protein [Halorhodospira abdelmalekii]
MSVLEDGKIFLFANLVSQTVFESAMQAQLDDGGDDFEFDADAGFTFFGTEDNGTEDNGTEANGTEANGTEANGNEGGAEDAPSVGDAIELISAGGTFVFDSNGDAG